MATMDSCVYIKIGSDMLSLIDETAKKFNMTRSELMRAGTILYIQQLLTLDSLHSLSGLMSKLEQQPDDGKTMEQIQNIIGTIEQITGQR